jgi:hypothetical protein
MAGSDDQHPQSVTDGTEMGKKKTRTETSGLKLDKADLQDPIKVFWFRLERLREKSATHTVTATAIENMKEAMNALAQAKENHQAQYLMHGEFPTVVQTIHDAKSDQLNRLDDRQKASNARIEALRYLHTEFPGRGLRDRFNAARANLKTKSAKGLATAQDILAVTNTLTAMVDSDDDFAFANSVVDDIINEVYVTEEAYEKLPQEEDRLYVHSTRSMAANQLRKTFYRKAVPKPTELQKIENTLTNIAFTPEAVTAADIGPIPHTLQSLLAKGKVSGRDARFLMGVYMIADIPDESLSRLRDREARTHIEMSPELDPHYMLNDLEKAKGVIAYLVKERAPHFSSELVPTIRLLYEEDVIDDQAAQKMLHTLATLDLKCTETDMNAAYKNDVQRVLDVYPTLAMPEPEPTPEPETQPQATSMTRKAHISQTSTCNVNVEFAYSIATNPYGDMTPETLIAELENVKNKILQGNLKPDELKQLYKALHVYETTLYADEVVTKEKIQWMTENREVLVALKSQVIPDYGDTYNKFIQTQSISISTIRPKSSPRKSAGPGEG